MARTWTQEEYCSQGEFYFSESAQEPISVVEMAPQYALNAYRKLLNEFGCDFANTVLGAALAARISPSASDLRVALDSFGRARIVPSDLTISGARSRLRRSGATRTRREGPWVVGEKDADISVSVRKVKH